MSSVNNVVTEENSTGDDSGYDITIATSEGRFLVFMEIPDVQEAQIVAQRLSTGSVASHDWVQIICVPSGSQINTLRDI